MKIYIICPVRGGVPGDVAQYVMALEEDGHAVHFPPRDAPQLDPTGSLICATHKGSMMCADEVHIFWDVDSKGSHFDLGMAYALGTKIKLVTIYKQDSDGKSYVKVMKAWEKESC